jgi:hypothetical protein
LLPYTLYGIFSRMNDMRKITAFIPRELLATAQEYTGAGVAETLRIALERLAREQFYRRMRELRGKGVKLDLNFDELREDREFDAQGNVIL